VHVGEERERDGARLGERRVAERGVAADAEQDGAAPRDLVGDLAQVAQLRRSDVAEVVTVEDEHDVRRSPEPGQADLAAARRGQREIGRGLAEPEAGHIALRYHAAREGTPP
jgi:hypothetical protein